MRKYNVLFAEDDPGDRIPLSDFLRSKGMNVAEVVSPQQAIQCLKMHPERVRIDLVILDLVMPEDNPQGGTEVLEYMKRAGLMIPVILATAWGYNGPAEEARCIYPEAVKAVLVKTFMGEEIVEVIRGVLASSKRRRSTGEGTD